MPWNEGYCYRQQLGPSADGLTAASYLAQAYRHSSVDVWHTRIAHGELELDGRTCRTDEPLRRGSWLIWNRPPWEEPEVPLGYDVAYEDRSVLVVDKPSGLPTLPAGGFLTQTLLHQVRIHHPTATPAHRLGRHTSGLLIFGKTPEAIRILFRSFRSGDVDKRYRAWASGIPTPGERTLDAPIGRMPYPPLGMLYVAAPAGRPARTSCRVLERRTANDGSKSFVAELRLHTGRPHQIRIHLAAAGHPLVGDPLYGSGGVPAEGSTARPGQGGYALQATELALEHPEARNMLRCRCEPLGTLRCSTDG